jgi:hypothetical protein
VKRDSHQPSQLGPLAALGLGFSIASVCTVAILNQTGAALGTGGDPGTGAVRLGGCVLLLCAAIDLGVAGLSTPMWRRQTPRHAFFRYGPFRGAFLWGLDTGLVFTTFRVTSLSWAGLALATLTIAPWWAGVAYAAGFLAPVCVAVASPWFTVGESTEVLGVQLRWLRFQQHLRRVAVPLMIVVGVSLITHTVV